ncbi:Adult-specific cuticular protein ACP-20 [Frankliniella fusca]|uniref:Adult-specific cuticular protein ACP-20 n=1 Tax=Frankliniella fusca TaxID=407009 RepID=A0AAE1HSV9_9NEOP|nr:Adult-specific cuticular protein ACP-20 [Frankliniella fusca]
MAVNAQLVVICAVAALVHCAASAPAYNHGGAYFNNGAYNRGGAYDNGAYNPAFDGGFYSPAQYSFDYRVAEPRTGDYKNHQESRSGDAVRGSYSVAEPDGSLLTVRYAADDAHGYTAQVTRSGAGGTVVQNFPGAAPLPVGAGAPYAGPAPYVAPAVVAPVVPAAAVAPAPLGHAHGGYNGAPYRAPFGGYPGGGYHGGFGTSSTTFHGPHAAYSYTN